VGYTLFPVGAPKCNKLHYEIFLVVIITSVCLETELWSKSFKITSSHAVSVYILVTYAGSSVVSLTFHGIYH
jgi:hypothetical protein